MDSAEVALPAYPFRLMALDYDGTLTLGARPSDDALAAIAEARGLGRLVVLVTGRILSELRHSFADVDQWFDAIVAENGAVLSMPRAHRLLAPPVAADLEDALFRRHVPLRAGDVLLACDAVHAGTVVEEIRRLQLDCQVLFNRGALMVLPAGVTKASGLGAALAEFGVSAHNVVAVGDAENDHTLLDASELGVAVDNAVKTLKNHADLVLSQPNGAGIVELLQGPIWLGRKRLRSSRHLLTLGADDEGRPVNAPASQVGLLIQGSSRTGKSYVGGLLIEQLVAQHYTVLVIDYEGDHPRLCELSGVLLLGDTGHPPTANEVARFLRHRATSVVVDLSMLDPEQQDRYVAELLPAVAATRRRTGLPHWLVIDEAHRAADALTVDGGCLDQMSGTCLITWRPEDLPQAVHDQMDLIIDLPSRGSGLIRRTGSDVDQPVRFGPRRTSHVRHWHKYTDTPLPEGRRFVLRRTASEPTGAVAANVSELHDLLGRCDPTVITHHAGHRDFSSWAAGALQDDDLADEFVVIERDLDHLGAETTRARIRHAIDRRYAEQ